MIKELDQVVLTKDLPDEGLKSGDIGTVVLVHQGGAGYEIEFITLTGETIEVVTVSDDDVRAIEEGEIAHVRKVA